MNQSPWTWTSRPDHSLVLINNSTLLQFTGIIPQADSQQGPLIPDAGWEFSLEDNVARWKKTGVLVFELHFDSHLSKPALRISLNITNIGKTPLYLNKVTVFQAASITNNTQWDRAVINGKDMIDIPYLKIIEGKLDDNCVSHSVIGLTDANGSDALVMGFLDLREAFYSFNGKLSAACDQEGTPTPPGATLSLSPLYMECGKSLSVLMDKYARTSGKVMNARQSASITGWCSWYHYYDTLANTDLWDNMNSIAKLPEQKHIKVIQIDDGWNLAGKGTPRLWGDWQAGGLFPEGMKSAAEGIKAKGFIPGLWLAPFSVDPTSKLYKDHPDWLVQDLQENKPADYWGVSALDLTHPEAIDFVRQTFIRVFNQWGFEYIKIDFLTQAVFPGRRYDSTITTARAFRNALQVIRGIALDRYILGCGSPMGPAVGIVDAMRVGYDISSRWDIRTPGSAEPWTNLCIRGGFIASMWRNWMQGRWWQNDADCLLVRDFGTDPEKDNFGLHIPAVRNAPAYGLSPEEASAWAQFLWFSRSLIMIGENVATLSPERLALLQTCFPINSQGSRWVDWYHDPWLFVLSSDDDCSIAVFNLTEKPVALEIPAERLGLQDQWIFKERLSGQTFQGNGKQVVFPEQPAHSGRVYQREEAQ